ncbi:MAG: peptidoglycan D,D-transpeptidase FtsI family protein, partial [Gaiellaceae bacterium]
ISRIAIVGLLLLTTLIVATTYWQTWAPASLKAKQDNAIQRVAQFRIDRGKIYASDGRTVLAKNVRKKGGGQTLYFRTYPTHGLASQVVGYSTQGRSRAGIEREENAYLTAGNANVGTIIEKLTENLKGATIRGNNLVLNIRVNAQKIAETALRGKCGAAVVVNPKTGQVYVMASSPGYDPNKIESPNGFSGILHSPAACPGSSAPLLNRATQGLYPPGSTFKTVTAAEALESGVYTPESHFYDPGYCMEYGKRISNAGDPEAPEQFGNVNFGQAYQHSINAVFCDIGKRLGARRVIDRAKDFGFYSKPPIELPSTEVAASGEFDTRKHGLFDDAGLADPGRLAFGQDKLLVTPLQMALVAAGVANNGTVMAPHLVNRVTGPDGGTVVKVHPAVWKHAMKPATAAELNAMMQAVVAGGTGTPAQIPGVKVAGKTGTAETGQNHVYDAWFIFFAPADNPKVAGAVVLEHQLNGFGGPVAGPIAKQLMQALLPPASKQ